MIAAFVLAAAMLVPAPQAERVPEAAMVNGIPQGIFIGRSLLTGKAVCLLFLSGGRITRAIPEGGFENFDWNRHRAAHGPDSGTWQMRGSQLIVTWGDGGVHQGPITVNADGIEFYGKKYSKPVSVSLAAIAGRWESARGTAIAGGSGINRVSELTIFPDGRYQGGSTVGGVVSGRAVASDRSTSGRVAVKGLTIVFTSDAGTSTAHTFLPAAGSPVSAFSVDTDMFTRSGPVPAVVPATAPSPAADAPDPAAGHRGLAFLTPSGWTRSIQQGHLILGPSAGLSDGAVVVVIYGAEGLNGRTFDAWFTARMAADLTGLKVLQAAPASQSRSGGLDLLSAGRTVQDGSGNVILQIYHAISDGRQAGAAMVATASEAALKRHISGAQAIFQSLKFAGTETAPAGAAPSPPAAAPGATKTTIAAADLVGHWDHASSSRFVATTTGSAKGYAQGYTFAADGTYTYAFTGTIDRTRFNESDSGTWGFQDGNLVIRSRQRNSVKTYRIVQFQTASDGSATMTLLDAYYPITDSNINVWGEKYTRKVKQPGGAAVAAEEK